MLGLLLFLVYINDIVEVFGDFLTVKLFPDDVKINVIIDSDTKVAVFVTECLTSDIFSMLLCGVSDCIYLYLV